MEKIEDRFGYHQAPKNGVGIIRARTTGQLRLWEVPRTLQALETVKREWGNLEYPGIYILIDIGGKRLYVGEAKDLYIRLKTHVSNPEDKIKDWNRVVVINDGRAAMQSDFNDAVIRKYFELYLINLFKANKYSVVSQGEPQKQNPLQSSIIRTLIDELNFLLMKMNMITKLIEETGQEEVLLDDLRRVIEKQGWKISNWGAYEATIEGRKTYIRPGSKKQKGWQITFRDRFKQALQEGEGYLLVPRDGILFIPFKEIQKVIVDESRFKQNTIDIYINFKEDIVKLSYGKNTIDITEYRILK
ncbi:MAG TPA: GIY-YIG nuclease family protein [Candidatus Brocadiales bacterium]|nr:GIY-YIG nuclease family protein [Candidatus Brocadiales bacterium]